MPSRQRHDRCAHERRVLQVADVDSAVFAITGPSWVAAWWQQNLHGMSDLATCLRANIPRSSHAETDDMALLLLNSGPRT